MRVYGFGKMGRASRLDGGLGAPRSRGPRSRGGGKRLFQGLPTRDLPSRVDIMRALAVSLVFAVCAFPGLCQEETSQPQEFLNRNLTNKDFAGEGLEGAKFLRVKLQTANFEGADLSDATFRQCLLKGAKFRGANFGPNTTFMESTLHEADFAGVDLKGADFRRVNLRGANLANSKGWGDLTDSTLAEADLRGADFSTAKGDLNSVQWSGAIYDSKTIFPQGFDPEAAGLVKK